MDRNSLVRMLAARITPATGRLVGDITGLGCLVAAAFLWGAGDGAAAGWAVLGVAVLLLVARSDQSLS